MFKIYGAPIQDLLDEMEQSSQGTEEEVDAVVFHPPCNTHRIAESVSSDGRLLLNDMSVLFDLMSFLMDPRAHEHIFCSALQFKTWYKRLKW